MLRMRCLFDRLQLSYGRYTPAGPHDKANVIVM
jgi:hypothetical protein